MSSRGYSFIPLSHPDLVAAYRETVGTPLAHVRFVGTAGGSCKPTLLELLFKENLGSSGYLAFRFRRGARVWVLPKSSVASKLFLVVLPAEINVAFFFF
jgi:hypothetical protein